MAGLVLFLLVPKLNRSEEGIAAARGVVSVGSAEAATIVDMEMWNNPSCSKCAGARNSLDAARVPYRLRAYLEQRPTAEELTEVLRRLGAQPWEICRTGEPAAVARGIADWPRDEANAARWINAMVEAPELIQRPILLLDDGSAIVGRTQDALDEAVRRARR